MTNDNSANTIERAYDLASSGMFQTVDSVVTRLKAEGYENVATNLRSRTFRRELRELCAAADRTC